MEILNINHKWYRFGAFYNIYSIINEVHYTACSSVLLPEQYQDLYLDTFYGRLISPELYGKPVYGISKDMNYYINFDHLNIIKYYRVPMRKIPIFEVEDFKTLPKLINEIKEKNSGYEILLRGQTTEYFLGRNEHEKEFFYGDPFSLEPSFLPSSLRKNFNEVFINCMWLNQAGILLNDLGYNYDIQLSTKDKDKYWNSVNYIKNGPFFIAFSLGIAQHYGLPSIGLDLTKDLNVAAWFALNKIDVNSDGIASSKLVNETFSPTIYVFRCPLNAVFPYENVKPDIFPLGRPDNQNAWFGHVGWGLAKNQLAGYLVCGFRLKISFSEFLAPSYESFLFPKMENDPILQFFMKMKNRATYIGEAKRALQGIYHF